MGFIINRPAVTQIVEQISQQVQEQLSRPVDPALLQAKAALLVAVTAPFLAKVQAGAATRNDLQQWRQDLREAGLGYIDYSSLLAIRVHSKRFAAMLQDRLDRAAEWAQAAINA